MLILYRFLTCSVQCSNWIPPCSHVLRILLGRESKRGLCSWTTVRTWYLFQSFCTTALHLGINQHATIGYGKTSALFFEMNFYWISWILSEWNAFDFSLHIQETCIYTCSSNNWTFYFLAHSAVMWERDHGATSPAADLLKFGHHKFTFWLMALSHLRMKVKFSPLFGITCRASSQSCIEKCSSLKLQILLKSSTTSRVLFSRKSLKK